MPDDNRPYAVVADDNAMIRMDAADILADAGFATLEAANSDEAIALLEQHHANVQLLFTDVEMPPGQRDGFALAREVAVRWPGIKVLVASGRVKPGPDDMPKGAVFIGKPFSATVVQNRIKELFPNGERPDPLQD